MLPQTSQRDSYQSKEVAEAEAFQDASEAFLVMKFEDTVLRASTYEEMDLDY